PPSCCSISTSDTAFSSVCLRPASGLALSASDVTSARTNGCGDAPISPISVTAHNSILPSTHPSAVSHVLICLSITAVVCRGTSPSHGSFSPIWSAFDSSTLFFFDRFSALSSKAALWSPTADTGVGNPSCEHVRVSTSG
ncbi:unnamed protein product, partial [Ectocarpus sp. 12 AP-2014]